MDLGLSKARVVVAGGSRGLGLAIVESFLKEGAQVWISGRKKQYLEKVKQENRGIEYTECDLETEAGRDLFFQDVKKTWATIDILILNIGGGASKEPSLDSSDAEWERVFNLNFFSHSSIIRKFKSILKSKNAAIISISSIAGQMRLPAPIQYGSAKAALNHFCVIAASELAQSAIRFNIVSPGNIFIPGGRWDELRSQNPEEVEEYIQTSVPLKRFARPEEVASVVVFLSSAKASFCTGSIFKVDGGQVPIG